MIKILITLDFKFEVNLQIKESEKKIWVLCTIWKGN